MRNHTNTSSTRTERPSRDHARSHTLDKPRSFTDADLYRARDKGTRSFVPRVDDVIVTEGDRHLLLAGLFEWCVARFIHLAAWTDIYRQFAFGDTRPDLNDADVPGDFSAGVAWLYGAQDDFIAAVGGLSDEAAFEPRPAHWGESVPVVRIVTTMLTEHVHHIFEDTRSASRHHHQFQTRVGGRARNRQTHDCRSALAVHS